MGTMLPGDGRVLRTRQGIPLRLRSMRSVALSRSSPQWGSLRRTHSTRLGKRRKQLMLSVIVGRVTFHSGAANQRTTMIDAGGSLNWCFSDRGDIVGNVEVGGYVLWMAYDGVGNRTLLIDPDNGRTTYSYDAVNRTATVMNPDG